MNKTNLILLAIVLTLLSGGNVFAEEASDYRLGDGDVVKIMVYDHPDLTSTARITNGGVLLFPLVGAINIDGMTVGEVADVLVKRLSDGFIVNPQVSVFVEEFRSKKALVMGQVAQPGLYELSGPTTLLELISKAGGLKEEAGAKVVVKRKKGEGEKEEQFTIDLHNLLEKGDTSLDIPIRDGDNIIVSEAGIFYVTGQVKKPDAYRLEPGTSVIKAITMAGGFTDLAATRDVKIIRKVEGYERVMEEVSMHEAIQPEDVVLVPESFF